MYPPNRPNPPSQHHAKEVISELCDRIKSEYTSMYSHIQSLKSELDKVSSQRADYERYYNMNQDMSYLFSNEVHKMMEVIKRLIQACVQQVPYLPPDLQSSCIHLIEQVKHYTAAEPSVPSLLHGPPPGHACPPPHPAHMNPPQGPMMPPMPHPMMNYVTRMPTQSPHYPEAREHCPPSDMRYKEKESRPAPNTDTYNGVCPREHVPSANSVAKPAVVPNRLSERENGPEPDESLPNSKESEEVEPLEKIENLHMETESNYPEDSEKSGPGNSSDSAIIENSQTIKKAEEEGSPQKVDPVSPSRTRTEVHAHPYQRPIPPVAPSPRPGPHKIPPFYMGMPKPPMNGSYMPMPHGYHSPYDPSHQFHMGMPPYPRHSPMPPFDPMMVPRPYGPVHPYPVPPAYSPYPPVDCSEAPHDPANTRVPKSFAPLGSLQHGDVVCAVAFSSPRGYVFTGSKGIVKIWDVAEFASPRLLSSIDCLKDNYVRACRSINENKLLVVSGEHPSVGVWSLTPNEAGGLSVNTVCEMVNPSPVCYNMAITPDEKHVYCCCSSGTIVGWDVETARPFRTFTGHVDGATSIDITRDGSLIWTGGLDATARCWDARDGKQAHSYSFPTQVFSLRVAPSSDYIVVGLENRTIELCYTRESVPLRAGERHVFKVHDSCVLTVCIANNGRWLVSSSKDNYTNCVALPGGAPLFLTRENASILCTDISFDDRHVISGGGEKKATIYECVYS